MKSVYLAAAFLVAAIASAQAQTVIECRNRCGDTTINEGSTTTATNNSTSSTSTSGGNVQASTVVSTQRGSAMIAPTVNLTSFGCTGSNAGGVTTPFVGFSVGGTDEMEGCLKLNASFALHAMGLTEDAIKVIKSMKVVKEALDPKAKEETPDAWADYPR